MAPDKTNIPIYTRYLVQNRHRKDVKEEIEKILHDDERGLNKSLYGKNYYLKKAADELRVDLTKI